LKDLMDRAGLTEPIVSQRIGVSQRIINHWKMRRKIPRLDNAVALADVLGVSIETLAESLGIEVRKDSSNSYLED
jgi:transcriptional regulator with XRE-family HTH domain